MTELWKQLKQRNVVQVGVAYVLVSWVLLQIADFALEVIDAPSWILQVMVLTAAIGLLAVLVFAWVFEMTPEGIKRESEIDRSQSVNPAAGRRLNAVIAAFLVIALGIFAFSRLPPSSEEVLSGSPEAARDQLPDSIAVLPFDDFSETGDQEYFSKGISEEILNLLAKTGSLRVAARTSSFAFYGTNEDIRDIGRKLDVETVLEGSIRKSGSTLRITAQLISVRDGFHLWSETYERDYGDIFRIQDDIAASIMDAMRVHLLGEQVPEVHSERTANLDAYSAYLIGRERLELLTPNDLSAAQEQLQKAIDLDPDYAPAHAALARSWLMAERFDPNGLGKLRKEADAAVETHIRRALELSPDLPEAIAIQGLHHLRRFRYEEARAALDRALELNPNYALAYTWRAELAEIEKRFRDMLMDRERAYQLDPMSLEIAENLAATYRNFWRPDDADRVIDRMFELHPGHPRAFAAAVMNLAHHGRSGEALLMRERAIEANPDIEFPISHGTLLAWLGLFEQAAATGDPVAQFLSAFFQERFREAEDILTEQLRLEGSGEWFGRARMLYAVYPDGGGGERLQKFVQMDIERLEAQGEPWQDQCKTALIQHLRLVGRADETGSMMENCRVWLQESLKAGYFCPCTMYFQLHIMLLDGQLEKSIEYARKWLSNGDANVGLHLDPIFQLLSDQPEYEALLALNARNLEREREIYRRGGGWAANEGQADASLQP